VLQLSSDSSDSLKIEELRRKWKKSLYMAPDSTLQVAKEMLAFGEKNENGEATSAGTNMLAGYYSKIGDSQQAIKLYKQNLEANEDQPQRHFAILNNLGNVYIKTGDFEKALEAHLSALNKADEGNDVERRAISRLNVAGVYGHLDKIEASLEFAQQAYALSSTHDLKPVKMQTAFQLAETYYHQGNDSLALTFADSLNRVAQLLGTEFGVKKSDEVKAKVYTRQGKYEKALDLIQGARQYYQKINNKEEVILQGSQEAFILQQLGFLDKSEKLIIELIPLAEQQDQKEQLLKLHQLLAEVQEQQGKISLSYQNFKKFKLYQDSVINIEKNKATERMMAEFEAEKREARIASLSQQAEIQVLELRDRNRTIVAGVVLFMLIMLFLYFFYTQQNAKKQRKQIEMEQRFLRSQLNPHFISNALVAVQSSLLEKDTAAAESYLVTFSRLMREILEHSREEFILVEDEIGLLRDYLEINQKRLKQQLAYGIKVDEGIDGSFDKIPPMMIQPFIENALEHGTPPEGRKLEINVEFQKLAKGVQVSILDNGGGISEKAVTDKRSLSTKIIKERIALLNKTLKDDIKLRIANRVDGVDGVAILLSLPLQ
ncbi:MAG: tetratricopeptide repeat protein, partial [Bacteroidota bacterium]